MACVRRTVSLPLAAGACALVVASVAATRHVAVGQSLAASAAQDSSADEASLALDRFDPGTPDGLFGRRPRAAIREWHHSQGASPTRYLNGPEAAELLRTAAAPAATPEAPLPLQAVPAVDPNASSAATAPAFTPAETDSSPAAPATVAAEEVDPRKTAETNIQQQPDADGREGSRQLSPEILVDRHLLRDGHPADALRAMNEILAPQEEHDLVLHDGFDFEYAQVAYAAGRTVTAIASANQYLAAAGREGQFYREALELLDSAEVQLDRAAERHRAEAERRRAARWPPATRSATARRAPEMAVLPGSAVALRRSRGDRRRVPGVRDGDPWRCRHRLLPAPDRAAGSRASPCRLTEADSPG